MGLQSKILWISIALFAVYGKGLCFDENDLKSLRDTARYAFNIVGMEPNMGMNNQTMNQVSQVFTHLPGIKLAMLTALGNLVIPFLFIILILSMIIFAISGSAAFFCSIVDCHGFFNVPHSRARPLYKKKDMLNKKSWEIFRPVAQAVHDSYEKYGD